MLSPLSQQRTGGLAGAGLGAGTVQWGRLGKPEVMALKLCGSGEKTEAASRSDSLCPSHKGHVLCGQRVENRHIKEVRDTFTLNQVVDVIVVSRGGEGGGGCKHF